MESKGSITFVEATMCLGLLITLIVFCVLELLALKFFFKKT